MVCENSGDGGGGGLTERSAKEFDGSLQQGELQREHVKEPPNRIAREHWASGSALEGGASNPAQTILGRAQTTRRHEKWSRVWATPNGLWAKPNGPGALKK